MRRHKLNSGDFNEWMLQEITDRYKNKSNLECHIIDNFIRQTVYYWPSGGARSNVLERDIPIDDAALGSENILFCFCILCI